MSIHEACVPGQGAWGRAAERATATPGACASHHPPPPFPLAHVHPPSSHPCVPVCPPPCRYELYFTLHQLIEAHKKDFEALAAAQAAAPQPADRERCAPCWPEGSRAARRLALLLPGSLAPAEPAMHPSLEPNRNPCTRSACAQAARRAGAAAPAARRAGQALGPGVPGAASRALGSQAAHGGVCAVAPAAAARRRRRCAAASARQLSAAPPSWPHTRRPF